MLLRRKCWLSGHLHVEYRMQTEDQILIAVYSAFGLLTIGSIAFRKFWVFIRVVEAAVIFPTSFLAFYFLLMTLAIPGGLQHNNALLAIAGVSGISALWVALFLPTSQYLKSTTLALMVVVGLLIGCVVGLHFLMPPAKWTFNNPSILLILLPMLVALHHLIAIGLSFWKITKST